MALITTCQSCGSQFKIVLDLLRVHHGLVRCGSCDHVFDARSSLSRIDDDQADHSLDPPADPAWTHKPVISALIGKPDVTTHTGSGAAHTSNSLGVQTQNWTQYLNASPPTETAQTDAAQKSAAGNETTEADDSFNPMTSLLTEEEAHAERLANAQRILAKRAASEPKPRIQKTPKTADEILATQERRRQRKADYLVQRESKNGSLKTDSVDLTQHHHAQLGFDLPLDNEPQGRSFEETSSLSAMGNSETNHTNSGNTSVSHIARLGLICLAVLASAVLILQVAVTQRHVIINQVPALKPLAINLCESLGCVVEPVEWLGALNLDSFSLSRIGNGATGSAQYQLQATVRNTSALIIKAPMLEVSLSNIQGNLITRKTVSLAELKSTTTQLNPNSDLVLESLLSLPADTVGYTSRLVYASQNAANK